MDPYPTHINARVPLMPPFHFQAQAQSALVGHSVTRLSRLALSRKEGQFNRHVDAVLARLCNGAVFRANGRHTVCVGRRVVGVHI
jgi:hypothetical protein